MKVSSTFLKRIALSFVRAFLASLLVFIVGLASAPEFSFTRAAAVSALVGALTAGIRAVQHVLEEG